MAPITHGVNCLGVNYPWHQLPGANCLASIAMTPFSKVHLFRPTPKNAKSNSKNEWYTFAVFQHDPTRLSKIGGLRLNSKIMVAAAVGGALLVGSWEKTGFVSFCCDIFPIANFARQYSHSQYPPSLRRNRKSILCCHEAAFYYSRRTPLSTSSSTGTKLERRKGNL